MSKTVTARIPDAIYEQARNQLSEVGATTSELVNSAFEYLIANKKLPANEQAIEPVGKHRIYRKLTKEQRDNLAMAIKACSIDADIPSNIQYDNEMLAKAKIEEYEALG